MQWQADRSGRLRRRHLAELASVYDTHYPKSSICRKNIAGSISKSVLACSCRHCLQERALLLALGPESVSCGCPNSRERLLCRDSNDQYTHVHPLGGSDSMTAGVGLDHKEDKAEWCVEVQQALRKVNLFALVSSASSKLKRRLAEHIALERHSQLRAICIYLCIRAREKLYILNHGESLSVI